MPTYSYVCKDCGHAFDIQQAFTDHALTACPQCSGALRKVYSAVGVVFKGSGFYRTDSQADRKQKSSTSSSSSDAPAASKESSNGTKAGSSSSVPAAAGASGSGSSGSSTG